MPPRRVPGLDSLRLPWLAAMAALSMCASVQAGERYPLAKDVATLDGIMHAYYDVISGPANTVRDKARDRSLHHPQAQIMVADADGDGRMRRMSVDEFHEWSKPVYDAGFYERELRREVRRYGDMYHVFSFYETRDTPDGPVTSRGINSIQLWNDGQRFWILAETWQSESERLPLPDRVETSYRSAAPEG